MPKKIFDLANEFEIGAIELVEILRSKGLSVRNHMATLEDDELAKAIVLLKADEVPKEEKPKKKTVKKKKAKKVTKKKVAVKRVVTTKEDIDSLGGDNKKTEKKVSAKTSTTIRKKAVIRRKVKVEDVDSVEVQEQVLESQVEITQENIIEQQNVNTQEVKQEDGIGLRVVSVPESKVVEEKEDRAVAESDPVEDKKEVFKEKVHKFTPVYIPPKTEKKVEASTSTDSKKQEEGAQTSDDSKNTRKRMGGLASIMTGKPKTNVSKSQQLLQTKSAEELKSYAALASTGKPLYTQVKRKKIYMGPSGQTAITEAKESKRIIGIHKVVTALELAHKLGIKFHNFADKLLDINLLVDEKDYIGLRLSKMIADVWSYKVEDRAFDEDEMLGISPKDEKEISKMPFRDPIITIMGHVDHGKTTLIDYIRDAKVAQGEAGGITQHVGAYQVEVNNRSLTFLDTPGHAAFTTIRQRGAQVTDIVILIVAADDGIMPQTKESIQFCRDADVPIIVAINKIDKESVNPDRIKQELAEFDLTPEEWGGQTQCVPISALKGTGVDELLEAIQLQAEIMELRSDPKSKVSGVVIESKVEQGRGPMATILVQEGTLKKGNIIIVGETYGRARSLMDFAGNLIPKAGPSVPVQILGLNSAPAPGDDLHVVNNEREAKKIVSNRIQERKENEIKVQKKAVSLEDFFSTYQDDAEFKELKLIIRTDVQGSYEAIKGSLEALTNQEVGIKVIGGGVGAISDSDVMLAAEANGYIIGFNMRPITSARKLAEQKGVDVKTYAIIYELINDVKLALEGLLEPEFEEKYIGRAEVRDTFMVPKIGMIAGSIVIDGKIQRGCSIRLLRSGKIIFDGKMASLKRFKDDVKEVNHGYECGIGLDGFNDLKLEDVFEAYVKEERKRKLEEVAALQDL